MRFTNDWKEVILKREALLEEDDRSARSVMKFAAWVEIKDQTLANGLQKRRRGDKSARAAMRWVEAVVRPSEETGEPWVVELLREWSRGC